MQTGKPEVIVEPTGPQLADLAARTGVTVPSSAAAVAVQGSDAGGYRIGVLPGNATAVAEIVSEEAAQPTAAALAGSEVSREEGVAGLTKPLLRAGEAGLIGPPGSLSGSRAFYMPLEGRLCIPGDYRYHANECQSFRSSCESTFYVYWVDGSELPPHYLVILRQHATFGIGDGMLHDADHIRGFGMFDAKTEVRNVQVSSGQVQLLRTSPDSGGRAAQVRAEVAMTQDVSGGRAIAPAVMSEYYSPDSPFTGWAGYNRSAPPDAKWEFAQDHTLNNGLNNGSLVANHYNDQTVKPYPAVTTSGLTVRTYAVWRVRPPEGRRDVTLSFGLELLQYFMLLTRGWLRPPNQDARGGPLYVMATGLQPFSLTLAEIVKPR